MVFSWIIFIGIAIVSFIVQSSLKSKFDKYSKVPLYNGMTGRRSSRKDAARQWYLRCKGYQHSGYAYRPF